MASAIRSIYLVRNQILLQAQTNLFRSLVLSRWEFSAIFCQILPSYSIDRILKQIRCLFWTKYDSAHKLFLGIKIDRTELQIAKTSLNRFFDIAQQTNIQGQKKFRIIADVEIKINNRTYDFSLTTKSKPKFNYKELRSEMEKTFKSSKKGKIKKN